MKKIYTLALAIFLMAGQQLSAQCDGRYQTDIFTNVDVSTVQYGSNQNLSGTTINLDMDIYQPQGDTATNRPVVLLAHGGSFIGGTKNDADMVYMATELAKKGYVCASINYRLATSAFQLIAEETTVKVVFNAIQDGKAAVRFFRQDAATTNTYKINPDQIFFGGASAGGILAINLTYVDDISDLPETAPSLWQSWLTSLGGLEGNSGNPGYCSRTNGTFGFAGGIADTAYIDPDDVPWYGSHALTDQTVRYDCGFPLSGSTPVDLCGSGIITTRLTNLGTYNHLDQYAGGTHPPYNGSASIMEDNKDSLAMFLYNILDCNPSNFQKPTQKTCANTSVSIAEVDNTVIDADIYPNPANDEINIALTNEYANNASISVINSVGKIVLRKNVSSNITQLSLSNLPTGIYFVKINSAKGTTQTQMVVKQ